MDKIVKCINDKKLPEGAHVVEGEKYTITKEFINQFGQRTYILRETVNEGITPRGLKWLGYSAERFTDTDIKEDLFKQEQQFVLN